MRTLLVVLLLLMASPASATSGACSYHSGVNCSIVGVYATCNDGSTSSVFYSDMTECRTNTCYYPATSGCTTQADYDSLQAREVQATSPALYRGYGDATYAATQSAQAASQYDAQLATCQSQITQYQQAISAYNECSSRYAKQSVAQVAAAAQTECINDTPVNAVASYKNDTCSYYCKDGYETNDGVSCVSIPAAPPIVAAPQPTPVMVPTVIPTASIPQKPVLKAVLPLKKAIKSKAPIIGTTTQVVPTSTSVAQSPTLVQKILSFFKKFFNW